MCASLAGASTWSSEKTFGLYSSVDKNTGGIYMLWLYSDRLLCAHGQESSAENDKWSCYILDFTHDLPTTGCTSLKPQQYQHIQFLSTQTRNVQMIIGGPTMILPMIAP